MDSGFKIQGSRFKKTSNLIPQILILNQKPETKNKKLKIPNLPVVPLAGRFQNPNPKANTKSEI